MKNLIKKLTIVFILSFSSLVSADDTDILGGGGAGANILFVMDLSGSMGWGKERRSTPTDTDPSRISILQGAFQDVIENPEFDEINFGLSVFSGRAQTSGRSVAHGITYPVSPILGDAQSILNKSHEITGTPVIEIKRQSPLRKSY